MGALKLKPNSKIYVDTSIVIYTIEQFPEYFPTLEPFWINLQLGNLTVFTSELTLLEVLIQPLRQENMVLVSAYEDFLQNAEIKLLPINQTILRKAAHLRAITKLKTPDAIHVATALLANCDQLFTNDSDFRKVPALSVKVLHEVIHEN